VKLARLPDSITRFLSAARARKTRTAARGGEGPEALTLRAVWVRDLLGPGGGGSHLGARQRAVWVRRVGLQP
jgi:hypothetical protein